MEGSQEREIKQLLAVARLYLDRAKELEKLEKTYREIWDKFGNGKVGNDDLNILRLSADLSSAAIRLSSVEMVIDMNAWKSRYNIDEKKEEKYWHFYLRDETAHEEPGFKSKGKWEKRKQRIEKVQLNESYQRVKQVEKRLHEDLKKKISSMGDWLRSGLPEWVQQMDSRTFVHGGESGGPESVSAAP